MNLHVDQVLIPLLGLVSLYFYNKKNIVWGAIIGLASEPFWFYAAYTTGQWGIFISSMMYTSMFCYGLWRELR